MLVAICVQRHCLQDRSAATLHRILVYHYLISSDKHLGVHSR
jgi:hypothetical protein